MDHTEAMGIVVAGALEALHAVADEVKEIFRNTVHGFGMNK